MPRQMPQLGSMLLAAALAVMVAPRRSMAEKSQQSGALLVLRQDGAGVDPRVAREVDQALAQALAHTGRAKAHFSPTPYAEARLVAGCGERAAPCLERLASDLGSEGVLVRELVRDARGTAQLTLMIHDGRSSTGIRRSTASLSRRPGGQPKQVVPLLVARLYPATTASLPELSAPSSRASTAARPVPAASAVAPATSPAAVPAVPFTPPQAVARDDQPREHRVDARAVLGWSSIASAGAMLLTGTVFAVLSDRDEQAYADQTIRSVADVDDAQSLLERSQREAKVANGLLIGGAGLAAVGAGLLIWKHISPREDRKSQPQWGVAPVRGGAALLVGGTTSGRRRR